MEITRTPRDRGTRLFGPFTNTRGLRVRCRCCKRSSSSAPARWTSTRKTRAGGGSVRACWPRSGNARPRATCGFPRKTTARASIACSSFSKARRRHCSDEMRQEMEAASKELHFEEAARLRDEIRLLETLDQRGKLDKHVQPEVFPVDPKKGLAGLQKVLHLRRAAADDRGHRHRPHRRHGDGGQRGAVLRRPAVQARLSAAADSHGRRAWTTSPASTRPSRGASNGSWTTAPKATRCPTFS